MCSVRRCTAPLHRRGQVFVCPQGHSHDIARTGYVNLLQPQDRHSFTAGDGRAVVEARAHLLTAGVGRAILDAFVREASSLDLPEGAVVVDLGSGSGEALGTLAAIRRITGIGVDLSRAAATYSARQFPDLTWLVANADRRLPILDGSVSLVLSLHARRNAAECHRILQRDGRLLVAIPSGDDLIELRAAIFGEGTERDRATGLIAEHGEHFTLLERTSARERHRLDRPALQNLLRGTYRGERVSVAAQVKALDQLEVTLASNIFMFQRRERV